MHFFSAPYTHTQWREANHDNLDLWRCLHISSVEAVAYTDAHFSYFPKQQSAELSEREREREREGALYPASRSMCSTFSGLYSSAVIQSVIFKKIKKGLFIESLLRCSYSVLRCLNHVFTAELVQ